MELIPGGTVRTLKNPGVSSRQLLCPDNSSGARVTLTEVRVEPGAVQPRHSHEGSEQVWYALCGAGRLLLAEGAEAPFAAGDVVRFACGETHGLRNDADGELVYLSVTSPPLSFRAAYQSESAPR